MATSLDPDMPTYEESISEMKEIRDSIDRLRTRDGELSTEEREKWMRLTARFEALAQHKESIERDSAMAKINERLEPSRKLHLAAQAQRQAVDDNAYDVDPMFEARSAEDLRRRNPWNMDGFRSFGRSPEELGSEYHARALDAVEKMPGATEKIREAGISILERFDDEDGKLSRLTLALSAPAYFRAFSKTSKNPYNPRLSDTEHYAVAEVQAAARGMSLTDAAGGFLVPFQLDPTVIQTASGVANGIRTVATQVIATGDVWNGVSAGDPQFSWDGESNENGGAGADVTVSDDTPTFAGPAISIHKGAGFIPISLEALADGANVAGNVARLLLNGRNNLENTAFATGTGTGQPRGIVTSLNGTSSVVASTTANAFAVDDLYALDSALPERFRSQSSWMANRAFYNLTRRLDTNGGAALWTQLQFGLPPELLGYRIVEAEAMDSTPTSSSATNLAAILGDFQYYYIADRIGFTVEFIPQLFGTGGRPTGKRGWYGYFRVGADCVNTNAFRMLDI